MKKLIFGLITLGLVVLQLQFSVHMADVQGLVVDAYSRVPLAGVKVSHLDQITFSDSNGKFVLKVSKYPTKVKFEYTGYATVTEWVGSNKSLIIELKPALVVEEELEVMTAEQRSPQIGKSERVRHLNLNMGGDHFTPPFNTENYGLIKENEYHSPIQSPLSTFAIDVDAASYSNMRRYLNRGSMPPKDAIRIEELVNYFQYDYPTPEGNNPFSVHTELAPCPWNSSHHLLHIGIRGKPILKENLPSSNLVFLIDVSGSMRDQNKLPLVKKAFRLLVDQLREPDRVALVVYAGNSGLVLPSTSGSDKTKIIRAIEQLEAGGSTAGSAGIKLAYETAVSSFIQGGNNRVILATDGDFNVGVSSDSELIHLIEEKRKSGVFLTVMGFGTGNYQEHKMQQLAQHGNGNHAYIDNILEAKKIMINEFGGTLHTIAKDVKVQVEFNPAKIQAYRLIGYENRLMQAVEFNDDTKDAGEMGAGHTVTALYEIIPQGIRSHFYINVDTLKYQKPPSINHSQIEWAQVKVRYKLPEQKQSQKISFQIKDLVWHASPDFNWSAGVAAFGMILRDSKFKGESDYLLVRKLCHSSTGKDPHGYRSEFLKMVESVQLLAGR